MTLVCLDLDDALTLYYVLIGEDVGREREDAAFMALARVVGKRERWEKLLETTPDQQHHQQDHQDDSDDPDGVAVVRHGDPTDQQQHQEDDEE